MTLLGLTGTENWSTWNTALGVWEDGENIARPLDWNDTILYLYPNAVAPLSALLSRLPKMKTTDPKFNWWTRRTPLQSGPVVGVFTDPAMTIAYGGGGLVNSFLYVETDVDTAQQFRAGHGALLNVGETDPLAYVNGYVVNVLSQGTRPYIAIMLIEDDDNSATNDMSSATEILVNGTINPEGGPMPTSIIYTPDRMLNVTQIFRTPFMLTRTQLQTDMAWGNEYYRQKKESLALFAIERERAFITGEMYEGVGANQQAMRATRGLIPYIINYGGLVENFPTSTVPGLTAGGTWAAEGLDWLDYCFSMTLRWGGRSRVGFIGNLALLAINQAIRNNNASSYSISAQLRAYGMRVMEFVTPQGTIDLIIHPLFMFTPMLQRTLLVFDPTQISRRFMQDTDFIADSMKQNTGVGRMDGRAEEFLAEDGLQIAHPEVTAFMTGFGLDRP